MEMRPHLHYVSLKRRVRRRKDSTRPRAFSRGKTFTIRSHLTCTHGRNNADSNHHSPFAALSRTRPHIWRHMRSFQLLAFVSVPEAFPLLSAQQRSISPLLTSDVCVCLDVCFWLHKLLTLSVFTLAWRTPARPCSQTFIFLPFFVLNVFVSTNLHRTQRLSKRVHLIFQPLHLEEKSAFFSAVCSSVFKTSPLSMETLPWSADLFGFGMC